MQDEKDNFRPQIFSTFPVDIVRLILEHLGSHCSNEAARLVRVSRLVHAWILPVLYETIRLKDVKDLFQIQCNLTAHPELAPHVRNVCLQLGSHGIPSADASLTRDIEAFFSRCQHVRSIYLDSTSLSFHYREACLPRLEDLHCGSWGSWLTHDILSFHPLTHLRMDLVHNTGMNASLARLLGPSPYALPHLTHLAFGADARATMSERRATLQFLRDMLGTRPRLEMLVVTLWFCWGPESEAMFGDVVDPRLCILTINAFTDSLSSVMEWEDAVRGRQSIWTKAQKIMEHREAHGHGTMASN